MGNVYKVSAQGFEVVHKWRPQTQGSWQPYTMLNVEDRLLTGQYPTGSVFEFLASNRSFVVPPTRVGVEPGAGTSHREAQTLTLYGDDILLGVWPCASRARS